MSNNNAEKTKKTFNDRFIEFFDRYTPNAMVFAIILTLIVAVLAIIFTGCPIFFNSPEGKVSLMNGWVNGFWSLLTFAMQMSLIMITGNVIAISPPVQKLIRKLSMLPNNWIQAYIMILVISWILMYIHWGIGMMVCIALLRSTLVAAKDKGYPVHAPALIACAYCTAIPAVGISQAAPLQGATAGFLKSMCTNEFAANYVADAYPLSESVLSWWNLTQCVVLFVMIAIVGYLIMPKNPLKMVGCSDELYADVKHTQTMYADKPDRSTPAAWLNNSPLLSMIVGIFGLIWCVQLYATQGFAGLTINNFNFTMLMLGIVLCGTPERFSKACIASVGAVWGVIIQFPLYAGIFGIISYTGLSDVISNAFMAISTTKTFPEVAYLYSAVLNMAVPSGGSKFVIECPYLLDVAAKLDVSVPKLLVAYTYGDQTTNIIQPFWALPYLTMCHIDFKKLLPYTMVICIGALIVCSFFFLVVY